MYCINCGTKLPDGAKFCFECGSPVNVVPVEDDEYSIKTSTADEIQNAETEDWITPAFVNDLSSKGKGNPKIYRSFRFQDRRSNDTFLFVTPFDIRQSIDVIYSAFKRCGDVKSVNPERGYIKAQLVESSLGKIIFETYITPIEDGKGCKVRIVIQSVWGSRQLLPPKTSDNVYDRFLRELFTIEPNVNFGVSLANKAPYVIAVNQLGSNIAMQTDSIIEQIPNVGGMIIGDFFFGEAGAIVGGMSGTRRSTGVTREVFVQNRLASVIFNNGKVYEGEIRAGTPLYNEVMAKI